MVHSVSTAIDNFGTTPKIGNKRRGVRLAHNDVVATCKITQEELRNLSGTRSAQVRKSNFDQV